MRTKNTPKRVTIRVLALMLVLMLLLPIYSMARYTNISSIFCDIVFTGERASCCVSVVGQPRTTKIEVTMTLQREVSTGVYSDVKTWTDSQTFTASSNLVVFDIIRQYYVPRDARYRTYAMVSVTRDGTTETEPAYSGTV